MFEYPFELCSNGPSTFQRVMDNILLDILKGKIPSLHRRYNLFPLIHGDLSRLPGGSQRLCTDNLKIQSDKCEFHRKEVAYPGHIITQEGVKRNPFKVDCIFNCSQPKTQNDNKSFLGLAGYYQRFIQNFVKNSCKSLTKLLQKDIPFDSDYE